MWEPCYQVGYICIGTLLNTAHNTGANLFSDEQRTILLRYFDEYGMTSTHRRNTELMERCANEVGTTLERVKVCACACLCVCARVQVHV